MTVPILCLVAFIFVLWVIVLKAEIADLKAENEKLESRFKAARAHDGVDVGR